MTGSTDEPHRDEALLARHPGRDAARTGRGAVPPVYPPRERLASLEAERGVVIPVVRVLDVPGLEPLAAFERLAAGEPYAALLETSEAGSGDADFSVVVPRAAGIVESGSSALDRVRAATRDRVADVGIELPRFVGGAVGMLGHEFATVLEPRVGRASGAPPADLPDALFLLVDDLVAFDHRTGRVLAISTIDVDRAPDLDRAYDRALGRIAAIGRELEALSASTPAAEAAEAPVGGAPAAVVPNVDDARFEAMAREARARVLAGECLQVVLSRRFDVHASIDPLAAYRSMRAISPAPYHVLLRLGDVSIVGASPEQLVGVAGDERVVTHPIAGTRPRGATRAQDLALEHELLADPKERAEHMMLVDLGRNDVARVARTGSVRVERVCEVERFSHVMHLVSRVEGTLRDGLHPVDALRAAFPAGTLTGAPKVRAMELIAALEPDRRGAYGGVVGYVGHGRAMDMAITIRTAVIDEAAGIASVQAGAGIVAASDPAAEAAETRHKARGMLVALVAAARSGTAALASAEPIGGAA